MAVPLNIQLLCAVFHSPSRYRSPNHPLSLFHSLLLLLSLSLPIDLSSVSLPLSGKMFQAPDLNLIVEFIFMFYKEKPIDWLLDHILWVKVCNPEKDAVRRNCVWGGGIFNFFSPSTLSSCRSIVRGRSRVCVCGSGPLFFNMWGCTPLWPERSRNSLWVPNLSSSL